MTGLVRLICEEPLLPPEGHGDRPLVVDVDPAEVAATVQRLQAEGWRLITEWPL